MFLLQEGGPRWNEVCGGGRGGEKKKVFSNNKKMIMIRGSSMSATRPVGFLAEIIKTPRRSPALPAPEHLPQKKKKAFLPHCVLCVPLGRKGEPLHWGQSVRGLNTSPRAHFPTQVEFRHSH